MSMTLIEETYGSMKKITASWVEASGAATATTTNVYNGALQRLVTVPNGSSAPAASYDLVVTDQDSTDTLVGAGANLSAASTEQALGTSIGVVANDTLTFTISNAGSSSGAGSVFLYIR